MQSQHLFFHRKKIIHNQNTPFKYLDNQYHHVPSIEKISGVENISNAVSSIYLFARQKTQLTHLQLSARFSRFFADREKKFKTLKPGEGSSWNKVFHQNSLADLFVLTEKIRKHLRLPRS